MADRFAQQVPEEHARCVVFRRVIVPVAVRGEDPRQALREQDVIEALDIRQAEPLSALPEDRVRGERELEQGRDVLAVQTRLLGDDRERLPDVLDLLAGIERDQVEGVGRVGVVGAELVEPGNDARAWAPSYPLAIRPSRWSVTASSPMKYCRQPAACRASSIGRSSSWPRSQQANRTPGVSRASRAQRSIVRP